MDDRTRSSAEQFHRFLLLPAELRCRIWQFAAKELLEGPSPNSVNSPPTSKLSKAGILTASRESQHEAEPIFYKDKIFTVDAPKETIDATGNGRRLIKQLIVDHMDLFTFGSVFKILNDDVIEAHVEVVVCSYDHGEEAKLKYAKAMVEKYMKYFERKKLKK